MQPQEGQQPAAEQEVEVLVAGSKAPMAPTQDAVEVVTNTKVSPAAAEEDDDVVEVVGGTAESALVKSLRRRIDELEKENQ